MPATSARPFPSVNRIGELPQSESAFAALLGICQRLLTASVVASRATIASDIVWLALLSVPVVTYTVLVEVSIAGVVQIPPPTWPFGTKLTDAATRWVVRSTRSSCPCTSGQSPRLAMPMYAELPTIRGLAQL